MVAEGGGGSGCYHLHRNGRGPADEDCMTDHLSSSNVPLVLHVIPTAVARGGQREARALADHLDLPGLRHHRVLNLFDGPHEVPTDFSIDHPGGTAPAVGFDPRLIYRLRSMLTRLDPTVLVAHGSEPLKYLVPVMVGRRRPMAYYAIGTYSGSGRRAQLELWRRLVARADVVAAEGDEVRAECIDRLGVPSERVKLVPNGRDPDVFRPHSRRSDPDEPLIIFVGALTTGKRPDRFIEVIAAVRAQGIPCRATVVGDGPLSEEIVSAAADAQVELLGSRSDVADQMRLADMMIFPSRPAGEGMPGVLIEAGLSGLPVVATDVPGVRSIILDDETGYVVGSDDLDGMVKATIGLLTEPGQRTAMGEAARIHCLGRFSMAAVGDRWMSLLQPLLDQAAGSGQ
jgi:glycosyltransferase involved in cell wall biosynthesis